MNLQCILAEIETNGGRLHRGRLLWLVAFIDDHVWHLDAGSEGRPLHHFGCTCYHPLFVFNQFGDMERCRLRPGNVQSAEDWRLVLEPVIARYRGRGIDLNFRADAAFAKPEIYELLEAEGIRYAIRLPANQVLQRRIGHLLKRPVGRPPKKPVVSYASFHYQADSWTRARRVVAKVEWHQGELYPRVGFIVTNLSRPAKRVVKFYNGRGTAEQWIKEGKNAAPLDAALLPCVPAQRCTPSAARAGLQPRQLPAHAGAAGGGRAVVAHHPAREPGQDRRPDRTPWPLRRVPVGRGGGAASAVRRDPPSDRRVRRPPIVAA
jgi:Transposase DDE domain group 1